MRSCWATSRGSPPPRFRWPPYYGGQRVLVEVALAPKSHREIDLPSERDGRRLERVEVKALFRLASYVVGRRADSGDLVLFDHLFTYIK